MSQFGIPEPKFVDVSMSCASMFFSKPGAYSEWSVSDIFVVVNVATLL